MSAKSAACPNCGATITFRWSGAVQSVRESFGLLSDAIGTKLGNSLFEAAVGIKGIRNGLPATTISGRRFLAAAGRRYPLPGFSPDNTDRRLVSIDRLQLPNRRTKLLTPSAARAGVQVLVNYNDRVRSYSQEKRLSIGYFRFSTRNFKAVKKVWKPCTVHPKNPS